MKDRNRAGRRVLNGMIVGNRTAGRPRPQNTTAQRGPWYRIQNFIDRPEAAAVYIYDSIGCWCWGDDCTCLTARNFVADLAALKVDILHVHINSPGGEVDDGVAIYNAIRSHRAHTTVHIDGLAASAASFIAMAGDKVLVARNAQVMIHDAMGIQFGNAGEMRTFADLLDRYSNNIADIYSQKTGQTVEAMRDVMRAETWFTGAEAVTAGLADDVDGQPDEAEEMVAARHDLSLYAFRYSGREQAPPPLLPTNQVEPVVEPAENVQVDPAAVVVPEVSTVTASSGGTVDTVEAVDAAPKPEPDEPADVETPVVDEWAAMTAHLLTPTPAPSEADAVFEALKKGLLR